MGGRREYYRECSAGRRESIRGKEVTKVILQKPMSALAASWW